MSHIAAPFRRPPETAPRPSHRCYRDCPRRGSRILGKVSELQRSPGPHGESHGLTSRSALTEVRLVVPPVLEPMGRLRVIGALNALLTGAVCCRVPCGTQMGAGSPCMVSASHCRSAPGMSRLNKPRVLASPTRRMEGSKPSLRAHSAILAVHHVPCCFPPVSRHCLQQCRAGKAHVQWEHFLHVLGPRILHIGYRKYRSSTSNLAVQSSSCCWPSVSRHRPQQCPARFQQ